MAQMWRRSFILCLVVWSLGQCIIPAHGLTPHPDPSLSSLDEMKPSDEYASGSQVMDKQHAGQERLVTEDKVCEVINVTKSRSGPQEIKKVKEEALTFYLRPKRSFRRMVFKISVKNVIGVWNEFSPEEVIAFSSSDLERSESKPWTLIKVKHFQDVLRVTVGNASLSLETDYSWLHNYKGFVIYVQGGAEVLFNCPPEVSQETESHVSNGVWMMAGLLITAGLLLTLLLGVWLSIKCRKKSETAPPLPQYPVYEEFDEEVLNKIRQKVEALRSGKSQDNLDNAGKSCYDATRYVIDVSLLKETDIVATTGKNVNPSERLYDNVYSVRPTPSPRKTKETPNAHTHYQNLPSLSHSQRDARRGFH